MRARWRALAQAYVARTRRERAMMTGGAVALTLGLGMLLFVDPAIRRHSSLQQQIELQRSDAAALEGQIDTLQARRNDPDAATRAQLEAIRQQLRMAEGELDLLQRSLVAPQDMGRLLEELLRSHRGLQLVALRNVPSTSLSELVEDAKPTGAASAAAAAGTAAKVPADGWLYRHGIEITLVGSYPDMQAYLTALEHMPRRVYWGELKIDARAWPVATMTVTLYTISLESTWWRV